MKGSDKYDISQACTLRSFRWTMGLSPSSSAEPLLSEKYKLGQQLEIKQQITDLDKRMLRS